MRIEGVEYPMVQIRAFRAAHGLPDAFGSALFQPKHDAALGSIDGAGDALHTLKTRVLEQSQALFQHGAKLSAIDGLYALFERELRAVNDAIGLRAVEIEYAAAGLSDMVAAYVYARLRASVSDEPMPDFDGVYGAWLQGSTRGASPVYEYPHAGAVWGVQIIASAFGRFGMLVALPDQVFFVADSALACPAEGFMAALMRDVCGLIAESGVVK